MRSYHNIESKRFPGHAYYVGYADGIWHIWKSNSSYGNWFAEKQVSDPKDYCRIYAFNLKQMSERLEAHAKKKED